MLSNASCHSEQGILMMANSVQRAQIMLRLPRIRMLAHPCIFWMALLPKTSSPSLSSQMLSCQTPRRVNEWWIKSAWEPNKREGGRETTGSLVWNMPDGSPAWPQRQAMDNFTFCIHFNATTYTGDKLASYFLQRGASSPWLFIAPMPFQNY